MVSSDSKEVQIILLSKLIVHGLFPEIHGQMMKEIPQKLKQKNKIILISYPKEIKHVKDSQLLAKKLKLLALSLIHISNNQIYPKTGSGVMLMDKIILVLPETNIFPNIVDHVGHMVPPLP